MRVSENTIEVGAFEAKNRLSELLRAAEAGQSIVITRRGRPVARLISAVEDLSEDLVELKTAFQELRSEIDGSVDVRDLVEEGRRW
jgi:prevent-host-death family protein